MFQTKLSKVDGKTDYFRGSFYLLSLKVPISHLLKRLASWSERIFEALTVLTFKSQFGYTSNNYDEKMKDLR